MVPLFEKILQLFLDEDNPVLQLLNGERDFHQSTTEITQEKGYILLTEILIFNREH